MAIDILNDLLPELTSVKVVPEPFVVGELSEGARPTSTSIITIPIPENSDVSDMSVTFRDRRSDYDDESRTVAPIFNATRSELNSTIDGWGSSDSTFAGRMWKRHIRNFSISNTSYRYIVYVSFEADTMYLMFQGIHAGNSNAYGGWENLTVNFKEFTQKSQLKSVEVMQLIGTYYPTLAESSAVSIQTGIDMTHPDTYLRVRYSDTSTDYTYVAEVIKPKDGFTNSHFPQTVNGFYEQGASLLALVIGIENDVTGIVQNVNAIVGSSNIVRINQIEVFAPQNIKVIK